MWPGLVHSMCPGRQVIMSRVVLGHVLRPRTTGKTRPNAGWAKSIAGALSSNANARRGKGMARQKVTLKILVDMLLKFCLTCSRSVSTWLVREDSAPVGAHGRQRTEGELV